MKRDMELCRQILFMVEERESARDPLFSIPEYPQEFVRYQCRLLEEAGFIDTVKTDLSGNVFLGELTWDGHNFLDKVRADTVWNKTKEVIVKKGLPMALETVIQIATAVLSSMTEGAIKAMIS